MKNIYIGVCSVLWGLGLVAMPLAVAYASVSVSIQSLSPSTTVAVGTSVTFTIAASGFTNPTYTLTDSTSGSPVSSGNINSSGVFSWTPNSSNVGTHTLTITVSDASGNTGTTVETLTVSPAPSVSIQSLSPSSSVTPGQTLTFTAVTTGFTNPTYTLTDSFGGSSVNNSDINSSGTFAWTPVSADTGSHVITITVTDSSGHSASATENIGVGTNATNSTSNVTVQGLSPGNSVIVGTPVMFTVAASSFTNPVFSLSDSFSGSSITNANINSTGYFSWTPGANQIGNHTVVVYVNDSSGHSGNVTLVLSIQNPNITVTSESPGSIVQPNVIFSFTMSQQGFTNPTYTVTDSFPNTSITNANINSTGTFSWTPANNQMGGHTITIYATDAAGHSANTSITVSVNSAVSLSLTAPSPGTSVAAGSAVSFQSYAYGFTSPLFSVSDSFLGSSVTNSTVNSSGSFYWVPTAQDTGTHMITITATDIYSHTATAQTTITVTSGTNGAPQAPAVFSGTSGMTQSQVQSILSLLQSFNADPSVIANVSASLGSGRVVTTNVIPNNTFVFSRFLAVGSTGSEVTELQKRLTTLGYYAGPITGRFGAQTRLATEKFQAAHGIKQVGYVGPSTRAALNQ